MTDRELNCFLILLIINLPFFVAARQEHCRLPESGQTSLPDSDGDQSEQMLHRVRSIFVSVSRVYLFYYLFCFYFLLSYCVLLFMILTIFVSVSRSLYLPLLSSLSSFVSLLSSCGSLFVCLFVSLNICISLFVPSVSLSKS